MILRDNTNLCQEDIYLKELVRYIHLNPLRGGIVADMKGLDEFQCCGHSVLMNKNAQPWQDTDKSLRTVKARALLRFWAHRKFGMTTVEISEKLNVGQLAVSRLSRRGEKMAIEEFLLFDEKKGIKS